MHSLTAAALVLGDVVSPWPYHSGNPVVDVILWGIYCVLFGIFLAWGMKIGNKLP